MFPISLQPPLTSSAVSCDLSLASAFLYERPLARCSDCVAGVKVWAGAVRQLFLLRVIGADRDGSQL
jgi:hypothetical protein